MVDEQIIIQTNKQTHVESEGNIGRVVDIDLDQMDLPALALHNTRQHGREYTARPAPVRIEVHNDWRAVLYCCYLVKVMAR